MDKRMNKKHTKKWIFAALQACDLTETALYDSLLYTLGACCVVAGEGPFLIPRYYDQFPYDNYWQHALRRSLIATEGVGTKHELGHQALGEVWTCYWGEGRRESNPAAAFLVKIIRQLDLYQEVDIYLAQQCCDALMAGVTDPSWRVWTRLNEKFGLWKVQLSKVEQMITKVAELFLEITGNSHQARPYLENVLISIPCQRNGEVPVFGLAN